MLVFLDLAKRVHTRVAQVMILSVRYESIFNLNQFLFLLQLLGTVTTTIRTVTI